jgi:hypothetical protein
LRKSGGMRNPPTVIHKPLAKAVRASATTEMGNSDDISTTRDSAARRSRYKIPIYLKKGIGLSEDRRLMSQYVTAPNNEDIKTAN